MPFIKPINSANIGFSLYTTQNSQFTILPIAVFLANRQRLDSPVIPLTYMVYLVRTIILLELLRNMVQICIMTSLSYYCRQVSQLLTVSKRPGYSTKTSAMLL